MSATQTFDFKTAIQKAITEFENAANAKSGSKLASYYAEDATLLPPGSAMIKGRADIQNFWQGFLDAGAADPKLRTTFVESSGNLAYELGTWDAIVPKPDGTGTARTSGKYLVVWKHMADGTLKIVADMFSPNA
jgi:uncharacterized protein (TIGR02246 family)